MLFRSEIQELVLTEPAPGMLARTRRRMTETGRAATVVQAAAEALPFEDSSFDTAVSTLVLCSVDDVDRVLGEIHRVVRPGGVLIFLEHVRSDDPRRARWQDRLERPWMAIADGCHPNRRTLERIAAAGFEVEEVERGELPKAVPIVKPLVAGYAVAR